MQSAVVVLLLVCAARGVLSCEPCKCSMGYGSSWPGLQVVKCVKLEELTAVPKTDKLSDNTQVLEIDGLFRRTPITTIKENQFASFKKLQVIRVAYNNVNNVERHAFRNMTNVTEINLDFNIITELPVGLFTHTPNLVKLSFFENKLKILPSYLFSNLKYLKIIWLNANQITSIEPNCFVDVPMLETVYLSTNKLTTLSMNMMDNSRSLRILTLESNPWLCDAALCGVMERVANGGLWGVIWGDWSYPACTAPQNLQGKRWDELKQHAVVRQCACTVAGSVVHCRAPLSPARVPDALLDNITHLHITDQQFSTLHNNVFSVYGLLQELHLERTHIHSIEPKAFANLSSLLTLNLADNNLKDLHTNTFTQTPNITKISLNKNNLTRLNKHQFSNLAMLKEVDLSFNTISVIEEDCFVNVSSLRIINLSNNQLQKLQLNVMESSMNLERLYLEGNPWRCDWALCGVLDAVVGGAMWGPGGAAPTCASPPHLAGKLWTQLHQYFQPDILILDSNQDWVQADTTSVLEARDVTLQCRYCFVSRVTWFLNGVKLPRKYQRSSREALISTLTMETIFKHEAGDYDCQVNQCPECDTARLHVTVNTTQPDTSGLQQENATELSQSDNGSVMAQA